MAISNASHSSCSGVPWIIIGCGFTSTAFLISKILILKNRFGAIDINFYRSIITLSLLFSYAIYFKKEIRSKHLCEHFKRATAGWIAAVLQMFAMSGSMPLPIVQVLFYTNPIFFVLIVYFWQKKAVFLNVWFGVVLGLIGSFTLLTNKQDWGHSQSLYSLVALASGFFTALTNFNIHALTAKGEPIWRIIFYYSAISTMYNLLWFLCVSRFPDNFSSNINLIFGISLGVLVLLSQFFMTKAYSVGNPSITTIFSYSHLIYATCFSYFLFNQKIDCISFLGISIIVLGGVLSTR